MWGSQFLATAQYLIVAIFAALALPNPTGQDLLSQLDTNIPGVWLTSKAMT